MQRKFVGDKMSIEASSNDGGRRWSVQLFDRGQLTTYPNWTESDLARLVLQRRMKPATPGIR